MRSRVDSLSVEITRPESARFHHALLLLHGLWTGAWIWERFASYLAHRGWESWAPDLLQPAPPFTDYDTLTTALERVANALPAPPIVVTHDIGAVAATLLATRVAVPAVIAIAPVAAPADTDPHRGLFAWPRFWLLRVAGARARPPSGAAAEAVFGTGSTAVPVHRLRADSGQIFRALASSRVRMPSRMTCPGLVLSGDRDSVSPPAVGAQLADRWGWEPQVSPGRGHFAMLEQGWEQVADDAHRWIVRTLGAGLLTLLEESEEP